MLRPILSVSFLLVVLVIMPGCAGRRFTRPPVGLLVVNETTMPEIRKKLGRPQENEKIILNGERIEKVRYSYANTYGVPAFPDVIPARSLTLHFWRDKLVGYGFVSSFKDDSTFFDDDSAATVRKGQAMAEIIQILGEPHGQQVFPLIQERNKTVYSYLYVQMRKFDLNSRPVNVQIYQQSLKLVTDGEGKVTSVTSSSSGRK